MILVDGTKAAQVRYELANDYERLCEYLELAALKYDSIRIASIGVSAEGRMIPVVKLGEGEVCNIYVGGMRANDAITPPVLLRFICDYAEYYTSGKRIYGINMQNLWKNRSLYVIPMLNPDGYIIRKNGVNGCIMSERLKRINISSGNGESDFSHWSFNACGRDIALSFGDENIPETDALKNYINYYADELDAVLDIGADVGIKYSVGKNVPARAKTVARLFSRMSGYNLESKNDEKGTLVEYVISSLGKNAYHIGCLDEGETAPISGSDYIKAYAALREALFSCPLL